MKKPVEDRLKELKTEFFDLRNMINDLEDREIELLTEIERLENKEMDVNEVLSQTNLNMN